MDFFTSFIISGLIPVFVWLGGVIVLRRRKADTLEYLTWLKWNAILYVFSSAAAGLLLWVLFPSNDMAGLTSMLD